MATFFLEKWFDRFYNSHAYDKLAIPCHFEQPPVMPHEDGVEIDFLGDIQEKDSLDDGFGDNNGRMDNVDNDDASEDEDVTLVMQQLLNPELNCTEVAEDDNDTADAIKLNYGGCSGVVSSELCCAIGNNQKYLASAFPMHNLCCHMFKMGNILMYILFWNNMIFLLMLEKRTIRFEELLV
jgi:hypothetical protein